MLVFHLDPGRIVAVHGEDSTRQRLREIIDFRIRLRPGDMVAEHTRTSNEVARLLFWEPTREAMMESIAFAEDLDA